MTETDEDALTEDISGFDGLAVILRTRELPKAVLFGFVSLAVSAAVTAFSPDALATAAVAFLGAALALWAIARINWEQTAEAVEEIDGEPTDNQSHE